MFDCFKCLKDVCIEKRLQDFELNKNEMPWDLLKQMNSNSKNILGFPVVLDPVSASLGGLA